jgi:hypothetical protein
MWAIKIQHVEGSRQDTWPNKKYKTWTVSSVTRGLIRNGHVDQQKYDTWSNEEVTYDPTAT